MSIPERLAGAHAGTNKTIICKVPSGWAAMCDMQFLHGYIIHLADPLVGSLNDLDLPARQLFLQDMALIGDALARVTGAYRINYAIAGNTDPFLHAHIVPRYLSEPEALRKGLPWSYPKAVMDADLFDLVRDRPLMVQLAAAILERIK